jgi:ADP-ribosyltransferase exoenzyme
MFEEEYIYSTLTDQYKYVDSLSTETIKAIKDYTGSEYEELNENLREDRPLTTRQLLLKDHLDTAFAGVPVTDTPLVVFRGEKQQHDIGGLKAYLSTTFDINQTEEFHGPKCCLFIITVSPGSRVLPLDMISKSRYEKEILLPRSGNMFITNMHYDGGLKVYDITYLPERSVEISEEMTQSTQTESSTTPSIAVWVNRVVDLTTPESVEIFGVEDALQFTLDELKSVPPEAVVLARQQLIKLYHHE